MRLIDAFDGDIGPVNNRALIGERQINGLTCDSRRVEPGFLFAALPGTQVDGRDYIAQAVANGAVAVLAEMGTEPSSELGDATLITAENPRQRYAEVAATYFERQPETIAAVTGTNGKTSVAGFLRQIWAGLGHRSASAGTLGIDLAGFDDTPELKHGFNLTTPDSVDLHCSLRELNDLGVQHLAIEASSHGLDQYRLDGLRITAAAFTNLTRDHLDYHVTLDAYLEAKTRLFADLVIDGGVAVINADDPYADAFRQAAQARGLRMLSYGENGNDLKILGVTATTRGQSIDAEVLGKHVQIELPLTGTFQAMNALCALGLAVAAGANRDHAIGCLSSLEGAPGRVQHVADHPSGAAIYVDYAHTPDALESVLRALRPHTENNLHVVFGCGGDRDPGKRPEMGAVAAECADHIIVTDDNPRSENPAVIRSQILKTCPGALEVGARDEAISKAIERLQAGDLLVVAGKGHETGQIVGRDVHPFDDGEIIRRVVHEVSS